MFRSLPRLYTKLLAIVVGSLVCATPATASLVQNAPQSVPPDYRQYADSFIEWFEDTFSSTPKSTTTPQGEGQKNEGRGAKGTGGASGGTNSGSKGGANPGGNSGSNPGGDRSGTPGGHGGDSNGTGGHSSN